MKWSYHSYDYRKKDCPRAKYRKKANHKKKVKTQEELNREAWREHRNARKRASKVRGLCRGHSKRSYKKFANKEHRARERAAMALHKYDDLSVSSKSVKKTHDPWDIY